MNELWPFGSKRRIWSLRRRTVRSARGIFREAHVPAKNESNPIRACGRELCEAFEWSPARLSGRRCLYYYKVYPIPRICQCGEVPVVTAAAAVYNGARQNGKDVPT